MRGQATKYLFKCHLIVSLRIIFFQGTKKPPSRRLSYSKNVQVSLAATFYM
jgi:hypothetical protein